MSEQHIQQSGQELAAEEPAGRTVWWILGASFALMTVSAIIMWVVFGPGMFASMLTAVVNCF